MSTPDLLLVDLYNSSRDPQTHDLAVRHAPLLRFDANEPFQPLAAGYTLFNEDGPSPSMARTVELRAEDRPPAARCIEYAIWWDWDIHHLYELEHVWIYLDGKDQPVRVEASWHGKYYEIPLQMENGRAVLLSEPGKHAFAPDPSWFHGRASRFRRAETLAVGAQAAVQINAMFAGKIRQKIFDRTLVRSYLYQQAFEPAWVFSKTFTLPAAGLVPWPALAEWIPRRVNAWLEKLEAAIQPADYRALRMISGNGTLESLGEAARSGADAVVLSARVNQGQLAIGGSHRERIDLNDVFQFCQAEPMGAFFVLEDTETVDRLAWFVRSNELQDYAAVLSPDAGLLARYRSFVPQGLAIAQLPYPDHGAVEAAQRSGAQFINPRWEMLSNGRDYLTPKWVQMLHAMGLGVASWPVRQINELKAMQQIGMDIVWQELPSP